MESIGHVAPAIAAHRGWHADGAQKNSIAALERAVTGGVDAVENDVRRLGDGTIVVHHDATLAGTPLDQLDRSVLAQHPHVATLDDWSRRAGVLGATALVELKEAGYEDDVLATLRRHIPEHRIQLMAFQPEVVTRLRELAPAREVGLLSRASAASGAQLVRDAQAVGASFLGLNVAQATEPILQTAEGAGLGVKVWTVDHRADIARLLADPRVDTVITDRPQLALDLRSALHGPRQASLGARLLGAATALR